MFAVNKINRFSVVQTILNRFAFCMITSNLLWTPGLPPLPAAAEEWSNLGQIFLRIDIGSSFSCARHLFRFAEIFLDHFGSLAMDVRRSPPESSQHLFKSSCTH